MTEEKLERKIAKKTLEYLKAQDKDVGKEPKLAWVVRIELCKLLNEWEQAQKRSV